MSVGFNIHCWVELKDGSIYDPYFYNYAEDYLFPRNTNKSEEEMRQIFQYMWEVCREYKPFDTAYKNQIWKLLWKGSNNTKETLTRIRQEETFRQAYLVNPIYSQCFYNAYAYHMQHPKATVMRIGSFGFRRKETIRWLFGDPEKPLLVEERTKGSSVTCGL